MMMQPRSAASIHQRVQNVIRAAGTPPPMMVRPCVYCGSPVVICERERRGLIGLVRVRLIRMHEVWPKPYSEHQLYRIKRLMSAHNFLRNDGPVTRRTATEIQQELHLCRWLTGDLH